MILGILLTGICLLNSKITIKNTFCSYENSLYFLVVFIFAPFFITWIVYSALVFLRSSDYLKFKLTVMLSETDFISSGIFYDSYSSLHCVRCFAKSYVGIIFLHIEHSMELQCLITFLTSLRVVYFSSSTRYFSSIF